MNKLNRPDLIWKEREYKRPIGYYIVAGIKIFGLIIIVATMLYFSVKGAN